MSYKEVSSLTTTNSDLIRAVLLPVGLYSIRMMSPGLLGAPLPVAISRKQTNALGQGVDGKMTGRTGPQQYPPFV